jgi:hypothetical protein
MEVLKFNGSSWNVEWIKSMTKTQFLKHPNNANYDEKKLIELYEIVKPPKKDKPIVEDLDGE